MWGVSNPGGEDGAYQGQDMDQKTRVKFKGVDPVQEIKRQVDDDEAEQEIPLSLKQKDD